jgi:hypothetical protein
MSLYEKSGTTHKDGTAYRAIPNKIMTNKSAVFVHRKVKASTAGTECMLTYDMSCPSNPTNLKL